MCLSTEPLPGTLGRGKKKREKEEKKVGRRGPEGAKAKEKSCTSLENDADRMAEQAEGSAGTKMVTLITESTYLSRQAKDKHKELIELDAEIG